MTKVSKKESIEAFRNVLSDINPSPFDMLHFPDGKPRTIYAVSLIKDEIGFLKVRASFFEPLTRFDLHDSFKVISKNIGPDDIIEIEDSRGDRFLVTSDKHHAFEEIDACPWDTLELKAV